MFATSRKWKSVLNIISCRFIFTYSTCIHRQNFQLWGNIFKPLKSAFYTHWLCNLFPVGLYNLVALEQDHWCVKIICLLGHYNMSLVLALIISHCTPRNQLGLLQDFFHQSISSACYLSIVSLGAFNDLIT